MVVGVLKDSVHYCLCYIKHETKKILLQDSGKKRAALLNRGSSVPFSHDTTHKWQEAWCQAAKAHALEEVLRGGRLRIGAIVFLRGGVDVGESQLLSVAWWGAGSWGERVLLMLLFFVEGTLLPGG